MEILKCTCGRSWCEFYDADSNVSYTRLGLEKHLKTLQEEVSAIEKLLK